MSSWLDLLPSSERQKVRAARKISPREYKKLREKIKSVEQIGEEMDRNEQLAELSFAIEAEPKLKEALQKQIEQDIAEQGLEAVVYAPEGVDIRVQEVLKQGFDVKVAENPESHKDQIMILPSGNIAEKLPVNFSLSEQYVQQFAAGMSEEE